MTDLGTYFVRQLAWAELRSQLERMLPPDRFFRLLRELREPLDEALLGIMLPPPTMAFDGKLGRRTVDEILQISAEWCQIALGDFPPSAKAQIEVSVRKIREETELLSRTVFGADNPDTTDYSNPATDRKVRRWMRYRVEHWPSDKPAPTQECDLAEAQKAFPGLSRDELRLVRESEAPPEWRRQGPRRLWGEVRK